MWNKIKKWFSGMFSTSITYSSTVIINGKEITDSAEKEKYVKVLKNAENKMDEVFRKAEEVFDSIEKDLK